MSGGAALPWRRSAQRAAHLVLAVALGTFVYSPLRTDPGFVLLVQVVLFPALVLSGLLMWKGARLRAWTRRRGVGGGAR